MARDVKRAGHTAADRQKVDSLLGLAARELVALNVQWTDQATDVYDTAASDWPQFRTMRAADTPI